MCFRAGQENTAVNGEKRCSVTSLVVIFRLNQHVGLFVQCKLKRLVQKIIIF